MSDGESKDLKKYEITNDGGNLKVRFLASDGTTTTFTFCERDFMGLFYAMKQAAIAMRWL